MKALLSPVVALGVKVLGTISDAIDQRTIGSRGAVAGRAAPGVPVPCAARCLEGSLRGGQAGQNGHAQTPATTAVREVRKQIKKQLATASPNEAKQLVVLDDYATGIMTALNTDGLQPFKSATVEASQMLEEIEASLQELSKKGEKSSR